MPFTRKGYNCQNYEIKNHLPLYPRQYRDVDRFLRIRADYLQCRAVSAASRDGILGSGADVDNTTIRAHFQHYIGLDPLYVV